MTADDRAGAAAELRRLLDDFTALRSGYVMQDIGLLEATRYERYGAVVRTADDRPMLVLKVNETWIPAKEADAIARIVAASFNALPVFMAALDAAEASLKTQAADYARESEGWKASMQENLRLVAEIERLKVYEKAYLDVVPFLFAHGMLNEATDEKR